MQQQETVCSGIRAFDDVIEGLRLGDNVVWQVDTLDDYIYFAKPFADQAIADRRTCIYLRFAPHRPILEPQPGLAIIDVDPRQGFDYFSSQVQEVIEKHGRKVFYIFDNLSALVEEWATDELLANFFQVTCPYLYELETVTYFALARGRHAHSAVARIRDTTQVLLDVYHVNHSTYVHPIKAWGRYTPQMFLPHLVEGDTWKPIFRSGDAAAVLSAGRRLPLGSEDNSTAPWESIYRKLIKYHSASSEQIKSDPELSALKQEMCRMLIGNHPEFDRLADEYLTIQDLFDIRDRLVGTGRIGGKAAGMLLARRILASDAQNAELFSRILEDHDSFYIGSDVFYTFLVENDLFRLRLQMKRDSSISREEYENVEARFVAGKFPSAIMEQFRSMLDYFGQAPVIVRSSSLLEDSFGNTFAGKYHSEFCVNQGDPEERLEAFTQAVKRVYASTLNPDALSYRLHRGLGDNDEQMAILVQRVSGMPYKDYFFPTLAGVAFSRNLYTWSDRIDPRQGVIRLVFGLGTRAVERVGSDYPRMLAVSNPLLRPETGLEVIKYSQQFVDLLNLRTNEFGTVSLEELLEDRDYPGLHLMVAIRSEDYIQDPISTHIGKEDDIILTFDNLIRKTEFVHLLGLMLTTLERAYRHPVDIEFTAHIDSDNRIRINLLQCRPLFLPGTAEPVTVPEGIPSEAVLFRSSRMISGGIRSGIRYAVYIDPRTYSAQPVETKRTIGRIIGAINRHPLVSDHGVIMLGPGRWGSSNIDLGINVGYSDIDNISVLVEVAREEAGQVPEVSYGTHFFQDLVESQIIYLPVYPDDPKAEFNASFFEFSPSVLTDLVPGTEAFENIIRVIDAPSLTRGKHIHVVADPQTQNAVCFLA